MSITAAQLGIPATFNAAVHFVDRNVDEGRGDRVAIECGDERVTYREVLRRVNQCGTALRDRLRVRPRDRVVLLLLDGPSFVYAFFGAIKIGAVPVPLNTLWKPADDEYVVRDSGAVAAIVSRELAGNIDAMSTEARAQLRRVVTTGAEFDELLATSNGSLEALETGRDDPAFWLYSSGSTGTPKGCVHLQHDMAICAEMYARRVLAISERDRTFSVAKLFFAYGLGNALYFPFSAGATTILWPGPPAPQYVYGVIERHRPTLFFSVPTGYGMLLAQPGDFDLSSVRHAVSAGEALPPALYERFKQRFGIEILDAIGSTEALHMFIGNRPGAVRPGSSGTVLDGYDARILDDEGVEVPAGEIGNLWIRGDSICAEYWNQPEKTAQTIQDGWIRTGDKYTQDAEGYFWYAGRSDDMLKVGGQWVSPVEVENALVGHPAVLECGVVGRQDHDGLSKPIAFVVLRGGASASPELAKELQQFVRDRLAEYKRPRWVEFMAELPKTATGKIQRFKLRSV